MHVWITASCSRHQHLLSSRVRKAACCWKQRWSSTRKHGQLEEVQRLTKKISTKRPHCFVDKIPAWLMPSPDAFTVGSTLILLLEYMEILQKCLRKSCHQVQLVVRDGTVTISQTAEWMVVHTSYQTAKLKRIQTSWETEFPGKFLAR